MICATVFRSLPKALIVLVQCYLQVIGIWLIYLIEFKVGTPTYGLTQLCYVMRDERDRSDISLQSGRDDDDWLTFLIALWLVGSY